MVNVNFEVPDDWAKAADDMEVSVKEYVQRMCRAGRRQFGYDRRNDTMPTLEHTDAASNTDAIKEFVERNLSVETGHNQDDLVKLVENDIIKALEELDDEGKAMYRPSKGGYIRVKDDE